MTVLVAADTVRAVEFTIGAAEEIYSKSKRSNEGGKYWPDGNFGVVPLGNGLYDFYAANGPKPVKTTGTLLDPGAKKKSVKINGLPKKTFNYVSGGPVYQDPASGARVMIYHAEKHGKSSKDFYSVLGMAVSTDPDGRKFQDLGTIIEPNMQFGQTEVGGGPFAVMDGYLHVYYRDWFPGVTTSELAVARAPVSEVIANALSGQGTAFSKYYDGSWSQPGRGGLSSYLESANPNNGWAAVSFNEYLNQLVMVSAQWSPTNPPDLYLATSTDGVNFSDRQPLALDPGEQFYPSLIGTGDDPQRTGKSFYVYYTDSQKGAWDRWKDAKLVRREITIDSLAQQAAQLTWSQISDFRSDFQAGGPANGWTYAWNPSGTLGDSSSFEPLVWSDAVNGYNTTGGANVVPTDETHNDDYLYLAAHFGHPGQPGYNPIVGYTIQEEDGAGMYRIIDGTIRKWDSTLSAGEDGLQIMIYRNDTLLGTRDVSTDGSLTIFDRDVGHLDVGDTVWVMVSALANQNYDSFSAFDFSMFKSVPAQLMAIAGSAVPEPATSTLLVLTLALAACRRPRRRTG